MLHKTALWHVKPGGCRKGERGVLRSRLQIATPALRYGPSVPPEPEPGSRVPGRSVRQGPRAAHGGSDSGTLGGQGERGRAHVSPASESAHGAQGLGNSLGRRGVFSESRAHTFPPQQAVVSSSPYRAAIWAGVSCCGNCSRVRTFFFKQRAVRGTNYRNNDLALGLATVAASPE